MTISSFKTSLAITAASAFVMAMAATSKAEEMATGSMSVEDETVLIVELPDDEATLRDLEMKHRRIINTAQRQCTVSLGGINRNDRDPCVISGVEAGVEQADDPQLTAFHTALPMSVRYDADRPANVWRIGQDDEAPDAVMTTE